jgi:hypothetical protein
VVQASKSGFRAVARLRAFGLFRRPALSSARETKPGYTEAGDDMAETSAPKHQIGWRATAPAVSSARETKPGYTKAGAGIDESSTPNHQIT